MFCTLHETHHCSVEEFFEVLLIRRTNQLSKGISLRDVPEGVVMIYRSTSTQPLRWKCLPLVKRFLAAFKQY
jgi:hypothetical protein